MASAKEIADVLELFVLAGLKGSLFDARLAKQMWAETNAAVLQNAAFEYIRTAKFMPTFAELTPFIEQEKQRRNWALEQEENTPKLSEVEIYQLALLQLAYREPVCAKCAGGSYLTNDERELSVREFQHQHGRLPNSEEIKPCDANCIGGHQVPKPSSIARLRAEIFGQPQSTTKTRKEKGMSYDNNGNTKVLRQ